MDQRQKFIHVNEQSYGMIYANSYSCSSCSVVWFRYSFSVAGKNFQHLPSLTRKFWVILIVLSRPTWSVKGMFTEHFYRVLRKIVSIKHPLGYVGNLRPEMGDTTNTYWKTFKISRSIFCVRVQTTRNCCIVLLALLRMIRSCRKRANKVTKLKTKEII